MKETFSIVSESGKVLESGLPFGGVIQRHNYWFKKTGSNCTIKSNLD